MSIRLSPSGIDYIDYSWNFYSGCLNWRNGICSVGGLCWAKKLTERFKSHYPNGFEPTFHPEAFLSPLHLRKPSIIGVAFMGDLFGDWVDPDKKFHSVMPSGKVSISMSLKGWIFTTIKQCPQHTFLFKTRCPWNLARWSPFPENCFVGVTATNRQEYLKATGNNGLDGIEARVKFISFEPLLEAIGASHYRLNAVNWVIIGACTGTGADLFNYGGGLKFMPYGRKWTLQPDISWVEEIIKTADEAGIKVFLKDNLKPLFQNITESKTRQLSSLITTVVCTDQEKELWSVKNLRQEVPK